MFILFYFFLLLLVNVLGVLQGRSEEMDGGRGNEIEAGIGKMCGLRALPDAKVRKQLLSGNGWLVAVYN